MATLDLTESPKPRVIARAEGTMQDSVYFRGMLQPGDFGPFEVFVNADCNVAVFRALQAFNREARWNGRYRITIEEIERGGERLEKNRANGET